MHDVQFVRGTYNSSVELCAFDPIVKQEAGGVIRNFIVLGEGAQKVLVGIFGTISFVAFQ